jgi:superfamily II DNA or RNA helicase
VSALAVGRPRAAGRTSISPQPRPDQATALAALGRTLSGGARAAQLISACGTGKTYIGRWHAEAAGARTAAVFVPSLALIAQTLGEWCTVTGSPWQFDALVVCSDPSTEEGAAERAEAGGSGPDRAAWASMWAGVTTSPQRVCEVLRARRSRPLVVFCTYHSAPAVAFACQQTGTVFDLVICDEAHHLAGWPQQSFRAVLHDGGVAAAKRLFMTATPQIVTSDTGDAVSMGDQQLFGSVAHRMSFGKAIAARLLVDYQVLVVAGYEEQAEPGTQALTTVPQALLDAASRHHLRSLLSFHSRVSDAAQFASLLDGVTLENGRTVRSRHVAGAMPAAHRAGVLKWLGQESAELRLAASAKCLSEGVDVPAVDGIVFADPRKSVVSIIQAVGRALRPAPGKKLATIVVPVTLPAGGDDDTSLLPSTFGHVWAVLRALRAHDERFAAELDACARRSTFTMRSLAGHRVRFLLPDRFDADELLFTRLVESTGAGWERLYGLLCDYAQSTGGAPLTSTVEWKGEPLGRWAAQQCSAHHRKLLPADRARRLEQVPGWAWDTEDRHWQATYAIAEGIAALRPRGLWQDPALPSVYAGEKDSRGRPLGLWAARQRQQYHAAVLARDRALLMEKLNGWDWDAGLPADDLAMVQALRLFCQLEQHADIAEGYDADGLPLGRWAWAVRRRRVTGRLHPALYDEIRAACQPDATGPSLFKWLKTQTRWRIGYSALRQFAAREGHARPPHNAREQLPDTIVNVGQWAALQRSKHQRGKLDRRYVRWLEALPGQPLDIQPGRHQEFGEPLDLGDENAHGRAKGAAAGCKCEPCVMYRSNADQAAQDRRRAERIPDPVPAGPARRRLDLLEAYAPRGVITEVSGVPLGALRMIGRGDKVVSARHEAALLATTPAMVEKAPQRIGSAGRPCSAGGQRIDAGPTRDLLADMDRRGFGAAWVARELGHEASTFHVSNAAPHCQVTRRVAGQVQRLHAATKGLVAPADRGRRVPRLAVLVAARDEAG